MTPPPSLPSPPLAHPAPSGRPLLRDDHRWLERLPTFKPLASLLRALAPVYGLVMRVRNTAYDRGYLSSRRLSVPVISVGNLVAGGVGKTPVVRWLAQAVSRQGLNPSAVAVITRGYGNRLARKPHRLTGDEPASIVGDEAFLLKKWLPSTDIFISPERYAVHSLLRQACALCLLDDGFQHRALWRDLDIVVASEQAPATLLPGGPGREPVEALERAQVLWIHSRLGHPIDEAGVPAWARAFRGMVVRSHYRPGALCPLNTPPLQEWVDEGRGGRRWWVVTGIANGERVLELLRHIELDIIGVSHYPDHHPFRSGDIRWVEQLAQAAGADGILTTEKDGARLAPLVGEMGLPWYYQAVEVVVTQGEEALGRLLRALVSSKNGKMSMDEKHTDIIT